MKNVIVVQSGGPTAVINGSLYGVIREALAHSGEIGHVYGMIHGIEGFLQDEILDLGKELSGAFPDETGKACHEVCRKSEGYRAYHALSNPGTADADHYLWLHLRRFLYGDRGGCCQLCVRYFVFLCTETH